MGCYSSCTSLLSTSKILGGFKDLLFASLPREMIPTLTSIFVQVGWFNHQTSLGFLTGRVACTESKHGISWDAEKTKQILAPGWQLHHHFVSITSSNMFNCCGSVIPKPTTWDIS